MGLSNTLHLISPEQFDNIISNGMYTAIWRNIHAIFMMGCTFISTLCNKLMKFIQMCTSMPKNVVCFNFLNQTTFWGITILKKIYDKIQLHSISNDSIHITPNSATRFSDLNRLFYGLGQVAQSACCL